MTECSCPSDHLEALAIALRGETRELCPTHDAEEIQRQAARAEAARLRQVVEAMTPPDELAQRRARREREAMDPIARALTDLHQPLGQPATSYPALSDYRNDDGPDAA